jgi:hypothetical protein
MMHGHTNIKDEKACENLKSYETTKHSQFIVIVAVTEIEA